MATKKLAYRKVVRNPQTSKLSVVFIDAQTGQEITDLTGYEIIDQGVPTPTIPPPTTPNTDKPASANSSDGSSAGRDSGYWDEWYANPNVSKGSGDFFGDIQKSLENVKSGFDTVTKPIKDVVDAGKELVLPGSSGRVDNETGLTDIPPIDGSAAKPDPNAPDPLAPKNGAYSKATWVKGNKDGVDPALLAIIDEAAVRSPYIVQLISGNDGRPTNPGSMHEKKKAVDIQLVNPDTGDVLPNYQSPETFRAYEQFAQTMKVVQEAKYPDKNNLAWGGYFWMEGPGSYGNMDLMHFSFGEQMGAGSWEKGLVSGKTKGLVSVGMADQQLAMSEPGKSPIPEIQQAEQVAQTTDAKPVNADVTSGTVKPMKSGIEDAVNAVRGMFSLPALAGAGIVGALNNVPAVPKELTTGTGAWAMNDAVNNWNQGKGSMTGDAIVKEIRNKIPEGVASARNAITSGVDALGNFAGGFMPNAQALIAGLANAVPIQGSQTAKTLAANTGFMSEDHPKSNAVDTGGVTRSLTGNVDNGLVSSEIAAPFSMADAERRDKIARTIVGEAAGEGYDGMMAVANVIKNRAMSGDYPVDPLDVVLQPNQFSAWNSISKGGNNLVNIDENDPIYKQAAKIADLVFSGQLPDNTGGSVMYHTNNITPYWSDEALNPTYGTMQIGNHTFYPQKSPDIPAPTTSKGFVEPTSTAPTGGSVTNEQRNAISAVPKSSFMTPTSSTKKVSSSGTDRFYGNILGENNSQNTAKTFTPTGGTVTTSQRNAIANTGNSKSYSGAESVVSSGGAKVSSSGSSATKTSTFMSSPSPAPKTTSSTKPSPIVSSGAAKASSSASSSQKVTTATGSTITKSQADAIRKL